MIARAPPRPRLSTAGPPVAGHGIGEDKPLDGGYLSGLLCSAGLWTEWCCLCNTLSADWLSNYMFQVFMINIFLKC